MPTDVLLIGYNSGDFEQYLASMSAGGVDQAAYRDARLAALRLDGAEHTAMDLLNAAAPGGPEFSNADFLWPVLTYLGCYLEDAGFSWDYVKLFREQRALLEQKLAAGGVRCVVITTTVYVSPQPILEIVALVRRLSPDTAIIVGGPYLADKPQTMPPGELPRLLDLLGADYYVFSSEGETTLARLLSVVCRGQGELAAVPNLAHRDQGSWAFTATEVESNSLEATPIRHTLFRPEDIGQFVSLRTAKSCPFKCSFCGFPGRAGKYTYLAVDDVERELNAIAALGSVTTLTFIDDTFNVPKPRFKDILRMMIANGYGFRWNSYLRSDHVDDEALELMRESGCEGVFLGVESGSAEQLKSMNKTSRPADYLRVIERCRQLGITTYASLIVGFPGETEQTIGETVAFLDAARPDFYRAQCWYADPYTPVFKDVDRHRIVGSGFVWSHRTMDSREASAWVDQMFSTVDSSIWLPQQGFELWSVFYLQRHGMSLDWIKSYLSAFNDTVRHRVIHGAFAAPPADLVAAVHERAAAWRTGGTAPALTRHAHSAATVRDGFDRWRAILSDAPSRAVHTWREFGAPGAGWSLSPHELPLWGEDVTAVTATVARAVQRAGGTGGDVLLLAGNAEAAFPMRFDARADFGAAATAQWADGHAVAHAADFALRFLQDMPGTVQAPDTAVLRTTSGSESAVIAALDGLSGRALGASLDVALLALPDGTWRLAHRRALSPDDEADLAAELTAAGAVRRPEPVLSFDL